MSNTNRNYKDTFFKFIFGSSKRKENTLALYNALNGSHYDNPNDLTINTLKDVFYIDMKNDVSFIIDDKLVLYEQQSTVNPNMPLRMLLYVSKIMNKYIKKEKINLYSHRKAEIPSPKCIVFYNGKENFPETRTYYLSDLFKKDYTGDIEVTVICYNINGTNNKTLKESCKQLGEYAYINDEIQRRIDEGIPLDETIQTTLDELPDTFILKELLEENRGAIMSVLEKEYSREEMRELDYKDGIEQGIEQGVKQGIQQSRVEVALSMLSENVPDEFIIRHLGIKKKELNKLKKTSLNTSIK